MRLQRIDPSSALLTLLSSDPLLAMSARVLYDSFVVDPLYVVIHPPVFQSWLRGLTAAELVADLPAQLHRHFQLHQSTTPQQRRHILRKRRHKRPSLSSSSSSPSSASSPSSLPQRVLSSPMAGSPNISRRPSAADDRLDAGMTHTIIQQLAALHIPSSAAATTNPTGAAGPAEDSPRAGSLSSSSDGDSSDDEVHLAAAALSSASYARLLSASQHSIHSQYRVFSMLSHYFHSPHLLSSPCPPLQLPAATISSLLAAYYAFHPPFVRELCGVKLKTLARGEVDVVGMRVGVRPVSAWRMMENVRRLYRVRWPERDEQEREDEPASGSGAMSGGNLSRNASLRWRHLRSAVGKMRVSGGKAGAGDDADELDDNAGSGGGMSTTALLSELYYLPVPLARSYTQLIFLCRHRIQADSKRLIGVGWEDMMLIAHWLMERWTVRLVDEEAAHRLNRHSSAPTLQKQSSASKSDKGTQDSLTSITPLPSPALTPATFTQTQTIPSPLAAMPSPYPYTAPNFPYGVFLSSLTSASPLMSAAAPLPTSPSLTPGHSSAAAALLSGVDEVGDSLDMDFIGELRSVKVHIADNRRLMDEYITAILANIRDYNTPPAPSSSPPSTPTAAALATSTRSQLYEKLKGRGVAVFVRALMGVAVPLGKPKRHRQLLVALVDDVVRLGVKGGLTGEEMAVMLECVSRGWEAVGEVRLKVNVLRERQREGLTVGVASGAGGVAVYNDEVARCYLNWIRFLSAVVPITALLYRRMRPLN